jgi:hypothetical protein
MTKNFQFHTTKGCSSGADHWTIMNRYIHEHKDESADHDKMMPPQSAPLGMSKWGQLEGRTNRNIHQFNCDTTGKRQNMAPHINKNLTPLNIFMFFSLWQWRASINTTHNTQTSST